MIKRRGSDIVLFSSFSIESLISGTTLLSDNPTSLEEVEKHLNYRNLGELLFYRLDIDVIS